MIHIVTAANDDNDVDVCDLRSKILRSSGSSYIYRLDSHMNKFVIQHRLRQNTAFLVDKIENFRLLVPTFIPELYRFNGNFLFILVHGYFDEVQEIFDTLWKMNIFNVFVIYEENDIASLLTTLPFVNPSSCGDTSAKVVARFSSQTNDKFVNFFFPKLKNLNLCPIRIATYLDPQNLMKRKFENGSFELFGNRYEFIKAIAKSLNYTNEIKVMEGHMPWGAIITNGSHVNITGAFKQLLDNKSDISFSEYFLKSGRNKYFDSSYPFYVTPMVFVIPPGRPFTPIEKLFQPFNQFVWLALVIVNLIALAVIVTINSKYRQYRSFVYGEKVKNPTINLLIAILGSQQSHLPKRNFARFILMMFLMLCLVMRSIYQGSIFQFLQSDGKHKEVQSIDEMIAKDFTFFMFESSLDFVQNHTEILKRTKFFTKDNFMFTDPPKGGEKIAALEALSDVQAWNIKNRKHFLHKICKEPLMSISIVIYMRKNFFLKTEFDNKIVSLISSGLIDYWLSDSFKELKDVRKKEPKELNLEELRGPFNILLIGYSTAFLVLLIEISVRSLKNSKNTFLCWKNHLK